MSDVPRARAGIDQVRIAQAQVGTHAANRLHAPCEPRLLGQCVEFHLCLARQRRRVHLRTLRGSQLGLRDLDQAANPGRVRRVVRTRIRWIRRIREHGPGVRRQATHLHRSRAASSLREEVCHRPSCDHAIGDRISILLVLVTGLANAAEELHAPALLHHMRGFVRRGVQARRRPERDLVPGRVRFRAHACRRGRCCTTHVGADRGHIVRRPERRLDPVCIR